MHIHALVIFIYTIKKNTETLIDASSDIGPEINVEKTKYMLLSPHRSIGQNLDKNSKQVI
jgi:hypothetical protein